MAKLKDTEINGSLTLFDNTSAAEQSSVIMKNIKGNLETKSSSIKTEIGENIISFNDGNIETDKPVSILIDADTPDSKATYDLYKDMDGKSKSLNFTRVNSVSLQGKTTSESPTGGMTFGSVDNYYNYKIEIISILTNTAIYTGYFYIHMYTSGGKMQYQSVTDKKVGKGENGIDFTGMPATTNISTLANLHNFKFYFKISFLSYYYFPLGGPLTEGSSLPPTVPWSDDASILDLEISGVSTPDIPLTIQKKEGTKVLSVNADGSLVSGYSYKSPSLSDETGLFVINYNNITYILLRDNVGNTVRSTLAPNNTYIECSANDGVLKLWTKESSGNTSVLIDPTHIAIRRLFS